MPYEFQDDAVRVMQPITITSSMIVSTTVSPEDPGALFVSGTTYAKGARVYSPVTHRVYESLKDSNTGHDPTVDANRFDATGTATWWYDAGPTNLYAMFDGLASTQTASASPLTVVLRPGAYNGLAMFGLEGDNLVITHKDKTGGTVLYSYNAPLEGSAPADYFEYFFEGFRPQTRFIVTGLEPYSMGELTVTVTRVTGQAKIGLLAVGDLKPLGVPLRGVSVEPQDYSYISTNEFGITETKKRYNATGMSIAAKMPVEDATVVLDVVRDLLGVPVVVIGSSKPNYNGMTVFGLLSGRMRYDEFGHNVLDMTVKGMV